MRISDYGKEQCGLWKDRGHMWNEMIKSVCSICATPLNMEKAPFIICRKAEHALSEKEEPVF